MKTIMARSSHDSSFSFSRRHFKWVLKKKEGGENRAGEEGEDEEEETTAFNNGTEDSVGQRKRGPAARLLSSAFLAAVAARMRSGKAAGGLGSRVTGTLFGHRRGHVHFAFQVDPKSPPVVLIELATPTSGLVREMASGLVRIALECERKGKKAVNGGGPSPKLLEEPLWRTYCNGKKCGYAIRRECGPADLDVLRAVEPVSMGAGVLPVAKSDNTGVNGAASADSEIMYMRAKFERVVGSRDSEAFYMMNPDGNGGPELSIYLLRV